jgi:hypothetical protein
MASTPDGKGYWLVADDGGIFSFGDARFSGSTGAMVLNKPIIGMTPTTDGLGYWLVADDGGIFSFGNAVFHGSTGGTPLAKPIVGITLSGTGGGYYLVGADGAVYPYGDAKGVPAAPVVTGSISAFSAPDVTEPIVAVTSATSYSPTVRSAGDPEEVDGGLLVSIEQ